MSAGTGLTPNSWYDVDFHCGTQTCPNYDIPQNVNPCWSNGGDITNAIYCGKCQTFCIIDQATYLDPQPIES